MRYLTSEVAANFIQILQSTPAEVLPAACDFIVDNFNSNQNNQDKTNHSPSNFKPTTQNLQ